MVATVVLPLSWTVAVAIVPARNGLKDREAAHEPETELGLKVVTVAVAADPPVAPVELLSAPFLFEGMAP